MKKKQFDENQKVRFQKYIEDNKKYLEDEQFWEFQTLQVFINDNPFDAAYTFLTPFEDVPDGEKCTLVGIIAKVQKKKDKNGKQFAYINIYSSFGLVEGIVWHSQLKEYEDLVKKGQQVAILCKKDSEEKVIVEKLKPYDNKLDLFKCYYPTSTYEKDFYTTHTEEQTQSFMREAIRDFDNKCEDVDVSDIIVENSNVPVGTLTIREAAIEKLKTMTDDEIKRRILL